jgi:hypothetical protein
MLLGKKKEEIYKEEENKESLETSPIKQQFIKS